MGNYFVETYGQQVDSWTALSCDEGVFVGFSVDFLVSLLEGVAVLDRFFVLRSRLLGVPDPGFFLFRLPEWGFDLYPLLSPFKPG